MTAATPSAAAAAIGWTQNLVAVPFAGPPGASAAELCRTVLELAASGARLVALFAPPGAAELVALLARDENNELAVVRGALDDGRAYPALTPELPAAQAFERELWELHGIEPVGHPWLKPLRRHAELEAAGRGAPHPFFQIAGQGVHEVAVGPVHAGVIEPGHFRFQCVGERVLHLEIQLGYQHRGAEALLLAGSPARRLAVAESLAGDTAVGHAQAHAGVLEALAEVEHPLRAQALRAVALELERLANHVGDLAALCNDVGYLPGAAWLGRLRGEFLNVLLALSGNRFGRGLVRLGGVRFDLDAGQRAELQARLVVAGADVRRVIDLVFDTPTVASRFERAGPLTRETAEALGLVGPAARACGCDRDVRRDHPAGLYRFVYIPISLAESGDVMARAQVRALEVERSLAFVREQLQELPDGPLAVPVPPARPERLAAALVEGWRGELVHVAVSGADGALAAYKVVDPSFHNWFGLALALRGQPISDFPLCNKSFNLSYAGHDL